jgi:hypothetical protein
VIGKVRKMLRMIKPIIDAEIPPTILDQFINKNYAYLKDDVELN